MSDVRLGGNKFLPGGQFIKARTLEYESLAWQAALRGYYSALTEPGVVNPDENLRVIIDGATSFRLSSGTAHAPGISLTTAFSTSVGSSVLVSRDDSWVTVGNPSRLPEYEGIGNPPHLGKVFPNTLTIENIPISSSSPGTLPSIFVSPTGSSLLKGHLTDTNFVWLIPYTESVNPTMTHTGTAVFSEYTESFKIAVTWAQMYLAYTLDGSNTGTYAMDTFVTQAIDSQRAVLLCSLTPYEGVWTEDSVDMSFRPIYPGRKDLAAIGGGDSTSRNRYSMVDTDLRKSVDVSSALWRSFPSMYVERRNFFYQESSSNVPRTYVGDVAVESGLQMLQDDASGTITSIPLAYYLQLNDHFPFYVLSITGTNGESYTRYADILRTTRCIFMGLNDVAHSDVRFTVTYGWINQCEPHEEMDTSATGNVGVVYLNQPMEKEYPIVDSVPVTTLVCPVRTINVPAKCPATYVYALDEYGHLDPYPSFSVPPFDLTAYASASFAFHRNVYPVTQPSTPSYLYWYLTRNCSANPLPVTEYISTTVDIERYLPTTSVTSPEIIAVASGCPNCYIRGTAEDGSYLTETIYFTKSRSGFLDTRDDAGASGMDWVGRYVRTTNKFKTVDNVDFSTGGWPTTEHASAVWSFLVIGEGIPLGTHLPVFSLDVDYSGKYLGNSFRDLRQDYMWRSLTEPLWGPGIVTNPGLTIAVTAGEALTKGHLVYVSPDDGMVYRALASGVGSPESELLGVVYPLGITPGSTGWVLRRGTFEMDFSDTLFSYYEGIQAGPICLSWETPGKPVSAESVADYVKNGALTYTPVVRGGICLGSSDSPDPSYSLFS